MARINLGRVALITLVLVTAAVLTAQRSDPPVFRSGVTVVNIDAIVTDQTGKPVVGLTAGDFEVKEAGKVRPIAAFAAVDRTDPPLAPLGDGEVEADTSDNIGASGRLYVFALSEVAPDKALRTRFLLRQFLDQYFGANDLAAVVLTGRGLADSGRDFTRNRRLLLEAIDRFSGGFDPPSETCLTGSGLGARQLASSLRRLAESMARLPGRKVLVFVAENTERLDFNLAEGYHGEAQSPAEADAHAAIAAATRGNITIYPIDPCGLVAEARGGDDLNRQMDLKRLAALTGGFATTNSNDFSGAFERLLEENSHFYTLGFESNQNREDGRFVRVDISVKRPGIQVHARPGYLAPIGHPRVPDSGPADGGFAAVAEALASPIPVPDVPLQVFAAPYRMASGETHLALSIEVGGRLLTGASGASGEATPFQVSYMATDSRGKVLPGRRHSLTVTRTADATDMRPTARVLSDLTLPPGRFQLRVAAGTRVQAGSVLVDLEIPDYKAARMALSGLFLTANNAASVTTLRPVEGLAATLSDPPIARRDFSRDETLGLLLDVYAPTAQDISLTTTLRRNDGQVTPLPLDARYSTIARMPQGFRFTGRMPLGSLIPGRYIVELQVSSAEEKPVTRRVPIRIH